MPSRFCDVPDCGKPHRAKGLCVTHYNQQDPNRHRKEVVACAHCGEPCEKEVGRTNRYNSLYCTMTCRTASQFTDLWRERVEGTLPVLDTRTAHARRVDRAMSRIKQPEEPSGSFKVGYCKVCGEGFVTRFFGLTTCSDDCLAIAKRDVKREHKHRRRARQRDAFVAPVMRIEIYDRDGGRCQICRRMVRFDVEVPHPLAPTLDHIIPLAVGGTHEPSNVRLAHFRCNARRGASDEPVQLLLVG